jgi:hypothetical protein
MGLPLPAAPADTSRHDAERRAAPRRITARRATRGAPPPLRGAASRPSACPRSTSIHPLESAMMDCGVPGLRVFCWRHRGVVRPTPGQ